MLKGAIGRRYAEAIFAIAREQDTIDRTLEDIQGIASLFSNRTLVYLLNEPKVPTRRKEQAIRQALASRVLPTSLNLALLVVQRQLVEAMPNIARELAQLVLDYKNQAVAEVTTAAPMMSSSSTASSRRWSTGQAKLFSWRQRFSRKFSVG
jgi:F-type H+-transporting ATPase subunit delta